MKNEQVKKLIFIALFMIVNLAAQAQVDTAGTIFVSRDYREGGSNAIVVKWLALKVYYEKGFNVYRQEKGASDWTKLNTEAINVTRTVPANIQQVDPDIKTLIDNINKLSYAEFQESIIRVFTAVKAVKSGYFAEILGVIHYDETAEDGKSYRYQVRGVLGSKEEIINTSEYISKGAYVPQKPPQNIVIDRKRKVIELNWTAEDDRFFGVHIYRSANGGPFERITKQARHIQKAPNQKGELEYPKVFFEDYEIDKKVSYTYKLSTVDYFGQEGSPSEVVKMPTVDFDAPPAPTGLKAEIHLKEVKLAWNATIAEDLMGYNLYRHHHATEGKVKVNAQPIIPSTLEFTDQVSELGYYYYSVAAVDESGNEGVSGDILVDIHDVFPPQIPQNVVVTPDSGQFTLKWDPVPDTDLAGYFVYRSLNDDDNSDNEFIGVNKDPITETQYVDELPKHIRNKFVYTVVAMDTSFNRSEHSKLSVVKLPDFTAPQAPFIRNIHTEPGEIRVDWLPNHEPDMAKYEVYRSIDTDSSNYQLLGEVTTSADNTYHDKTPHYGSTYFYYLRAVDESGNISRNSNIYEGVVYDDSDAYIKNELNDIGAYDIRLKYNRKKKYVDVSWSNRDTPELLGVVIYRGSTEKNLKSLTGLQKSTSYRDKSVNPGTYVYQIQTYDVNGHKTKSKAFSVTVK